MKTHTTHEHSHSVRKLVREGYAKIAQDIRHGGNSPSATPPRA
jgi:hypothetical protein